MLKSSIVVALLLVSADCIAQSREVGLAILKDTTFNYHGTAFSLRQAYIGRQGSLVRFRGEIMHSDSLPWSTVTLHLHLQDEGLAPIGGYGGTYPIEVTVHGPLAPNEPHRIDWSLPSETASRTRYAKVDLARAGYEVDYQFQLLNSPDNTLRYEDDHISLLIIPSYWAIHFAAENKGNSAAIIDWDQVSIVDASGKAHRVMHEGVAYEDRFRSLPPTVIPPRASIRDRVIPSDMLEYMGTERGWVSGELLDRLYPAAMLNVGKTVGLYLPLRIGGKEFEHFFEIEVTGITRKQ